MDNTREKYAKEGRLKQAQPSNREILNRLDQMTKELKQIKAILNMETDDGK